MRLLLSSMLLLLGACGGPTHRFVRRPVTVAPGQAPAPVPSEVSAAPESMQLRRLRWEQHQATPGCFFFRGPPIPGREIREPLVDTGSTVRVTTRGARTVVTLGDAPFVGEGRRLSRESTFLYIRKWYVTEALRFDDETYRAGTYEYGECNTLDGAGCRSRCVINSRFTLE